MFEVTNGPSKIELGSFGSEPFFDLRYQALRANPQTLRQPKDGLKGRLSHPTLKHRDKGRMQVALQSEGFLGKSGFQASRSHHIPKCRISSFALFALGHAAQRDPKCAVNLTDYSLWLTTTIVCSNHREGC